MKKDNRENRVVESVTKKAGGSAAEWAASVRADVAENGLFSWLAFLLLIIPAMKMYVVQLHPIVDNFFDFWGVASLVVLSVYFIRRWSALKHREFWYLILFCVVYLVTTVLHNSDQILGAASETIRLLIMPAYLMLAYDSGSADFRCALRRFRLCFIAVLLTDSFFALLQTTGLQIFRTPSHSILGLDNYATFSILPMLVMVLLVSQYLDGKLNKMDVAVCVLALLSKLATLSLMASISLAVFLVLLFVALRFEKVSKWVSPRLAFVMVVIALVGVVVFEVQKLLAPLLVALGKGVTLNYRTVIWDRTIKGILESPFIGYGKCVDSQFKTIVGLSVLHDHEASHPHNFLMSILFSTGLLGFIAYMRMVFGTFKKAMQLHASSLRSIANAGFVAFMILGFADDYIFQQFFYLLLMTVILLWDDEGNREKPSIFQRHR